MRRILVFHPTIAPYRIDFFNSISRHFITRICLFYENLRDQKFDYKSITSRFIFKPLYLNHLMTIKGRVICRGFWKQIKEFRPDIVFVSEFGIDAVAAIVYRFISQQKYRIISICDDSHDMLLSNDDFSRLHKNLRRLIVPQIDDLVLVHPKAKEWYNKKYGKGVFFPIVADEKRVRSEYNDAIESSNKLIKEYSLIGTKVILYVGRLSKIKNIDFLIQQFKEIDNSDYRLVIVGNGDEEENLKQISKDYDNIIIAGRFEGKSLYAWYNIANVFVLPSIREPFGAVTNEALLGGCKVLITDKAGSSCLVKEGENGLLFSPNDSTDFKQKLVKLLASSSPITFIDHIRDSKMPNTYDNYLIELFRQLRLNK